MNGDALRRRYEIRDADSGEVVEGPAFVLRPDKDEFAQSCLFAYTALCGLDYPMGAAVAMHIDPSDPKDRELLEAIAENIDLPQPIKHQGMCESVGGDQFARQSRIGEGSDGTVEYVYNLWRSLGYEPASVVMRAIPEEEQKKAKTWLEEHEARALAEEQASHKAAERVL